MADADFYAALGVQRQAPRHVLRSAYFANIRKSHPDRNSGWDAEERSAFLTEAYRVLSDEWHRSVYDLMGHAAFYHFSDVVASFSEFLITGTRVCELAAWRARGPLQRALDGTRHVLRAPCCGGPAGARCPTLLRLSPDGKFLVLGENATSQLRATASSARVRGDGKRLQLLDEEGSGGGVLEAELLEESRQVIRVGDVVAVGRAADLSSDVDAPTTARALGACSARYMYVKHAGGALELLCADSDACAFLHGRLTLLLIHLQRNKHWLGRFYETRLQSNAEDIAVL